jgi:fusarinine C synthase
MAPSVAQLPTAGSEDLGGPSDQISHNDLAQIWQWNATIPETISRSIHEYFTSFAVHHPEKTAILAWDGQISYGDLHDLSNRLGHKIRQMGFPPRTPVLLCFEKSLWTSVAVLAVMKAGYAFVLTDPVQPEGRLKTIATEIDATLILTSATYCQIGSKIAPSAQTLAVDAELAEKLNTEPVDDLPPVSGDSTMYIIFTSGSTGKPKGVVITHENYTSGAVRRAEIVGYREHTRVLDFASYAFDVSIDCMLCTLALGGCICIPSEEDRVNDLSGVIRKMEVNMVHTTPSVARILDPDIISTLEVLGLGGEAIPPQDASEWRQQTRVVIAYGPSECTVGCAFNNNVVIGGSYTSLGKGVGGRLWVVDPTDHNRLLPVGETGELLVEGPIVGRGYLNEPEKTQAVFIQDPDWLQDGFKSIPGRRGTLYKTGDLVHYDPDGSGAVVFVGRKDQQVKLRGQRVELGEVEHHVRRKLPNKIGVAAEVIRPGGQGDPTLVAFIAESQDADQKSSSIALQNFGCDLKHEIAEAKKTLVDEIPKYMIPTTFIPVTQIPITVSGKTDRKQLQAIGSALSRKELAMLRTDPITSQQPETELERRLKALWTALLGEGPEIRGSDDFFALGGDSLKAMKLVANAREEGLALTVSDIFRYPTLSEMASHTRTSGQVEEQTVQPFSLIAAGWSLLEARGRAAELCGVRSEIIEDMYPCTPLQEGLMALSAKFPEAYVAQRVLDLEDEATALRFQDAFDKSVLQSPILRTRIVQVAQHGLFQVVVRESIKWQQANQLDQYLLRDREEPMELGKPLLRVARVSNDTKGSVKIVLTMHHALYDGWSMPLIVERINRNYNSLSSQRPAEFKNFVRYLSDMDDIAAAQFWKQHLDGTSTRQFPALPEIGYQTKADSLLEHYMSVSKASTSTNTMTTIIRAAWAIVSSQLSSSNDVVFGETLTGRNIPVLGVEQIEGPMITTVPMRVQLGMETSDELLKDVQRHTVDRMPHEHMGLQHIRKLSPDARHACDLRTGIVLHPNADGDETVSAKGLADGLVPANDAEAAQEALKFNSYALMLVCSLDSSGFLTMASFDSHTVSTEVMQEALEAFDIAVQLLCGGNVSISDIQNSIVSAKPKLLSYLKGTSQLEASNGEISPSSATEKRNVPEVNRHAAHEHDNGTNEALLLNICSSILHMAPNDISPTDSFFELGGDSIAAMKLVAELRQHNLLLSVAQIFSTKCLRDMAGCLRAPSAEPTKNNTATELRPSSSLASSEGKVKPLLADQNWQITDILPARPLQDIAVKGTTDLPRYSARYEMIFFDQPVEAHRLFEACQRTVDANEILRTVFTRIEDSCISVVVDHVDIVTSMYSIDTNIRDFTQQLCHLDIQTLMPLGEQFIKFMLIKGGANEACLIIRISHAQYDEMCLPTMLEQISAFYSQKEIPRSVPFSNFFRHVQHVMPQAVSYWRNQLAGASMTTIPPPTQSVDTKTSPQVSLMKRLDIAKRPKAFTLATFPTAAWALTLARRLKVTDVTFGEVVSGRDLVGLDDGHSIMGPCWQYIPFRAQLQQDWTAADLLSAVQEQHVNSAPYSALGLSEILEHCVDDSFDTAKKGWFDSVVHQALQGVTELDFGNGNIARTETLYPHAEPLREWKVQSFVEEDGNAMTLEIVTFEAWRELGQELLDKLVGNFERLVEGGDGRILEM